jgi:hypothetical protein
MAVANSQDKKIKVFLLLFVHKKKILPFLSSHRHLTCDIFSCPKPSHMGMFRLSESLYLA